VLPLLQHYSAGGRVTRAAGPHTHLALPTSSARATTTRNVQDFTAADILASRLVLTTGGSATPTPALILPPGMRCSTGTRMPGYPLTTLWINNPTFDIDHRHWHLGGMLTKTPPLTELQIPATVTTLREGPGNHVLDGVQIPMGWAILGRKGTSRCKV